MSHRADQAQGYDFQWLRREAPVDGHATIFLSDDDTAQLPSRRRLADWNGIPLTFKVLVSQNAQQIATSHPERVVIRGDFQAGRARLFEFLDELATRQLFDPKQLADQVAALVALLYGVTPVQPCVTLEVDTAPVEVVSEAASSAAPNTASHAEPDGVPVHADADPVTTGEGLGARHAFPADVPDFVAPYGQPSPAQSLLDEVSDVDGLIARALTQLSDLKAAGQTDEMWRMLGIKGRQSNIDRPPSVGSPTSGYPATNRFAPPRPAPSRYVSLPTALKVVCIINIVGSSLAALGGIILLFASLKLGSGLAALLSLLALAMAITGIVLAVQMMNGSRTARTVFVVLTIVSIPLVIYNMTHGSAWQSIVNLIITIVYLVILFSDESNEYFDYVSGPPSKRRR